MKTKYRIVTDKFAGYEVQYKYWWWPFWMQGWTNTHGTIEQAERYAQAHAAGILREQQEHISRLVKDLGAL